MTNKIPFELNSKPVEAEAGETVWQVAQRHGTKIRTRAGIRRPGYRADGNFRACMVEAKFGKWLCWVIASLDPTYRLRRI